MTEAAASGPPDSRRVLAGYFTLAGLYTLSAAAIWGVNTLFLLDAGLSFFEVFVANAAFSAGMVVFEVPTGVVADTLGRRVSFLLSVAVLAATTLLYVALAEIGAGVVAFAAVSVAMGLGFTFYSGAMEAWLVDALAATGYTGRARPRLRARPAGHRRRDADRNGRRRAARPDRPLAAVRRPLRAPRSGLRRRLGRDARPRLHAAPGHGARAARGGRPQRPRGRPLRVVAALAAPPDARVARADGVPHVGVLCLAAVPARPARERRDLGRRARRVGDRALDDRRQPARPGALAALRPADDPPPRRRRRGDVRGGRPRAGRIVLGRAAGAPARDRLDRRDEPRATGVPAPGRAVRAARDRRVVRLAGLQRRWRRRPAGSRGARRGARRGHGLRRRAASPRRRRSHCVARVRSLGGPADRIGDEPAGVESPCAASGLPDVVAVETEAAA